MPGRGRTAVVAALSALSIVAGCASSVTGGGHGSAPPSRSTSTPQGTDVALTQQQAQDALLSVTDIGAGFVQQASSDDANPLPCAQDQPPLDRQFSPTAKAQADFALPDDKAAVSEEIVVYADEATAIRALSTGERGLACHSATIKAGSGRLTVKISGPTDLKAGLGVDLKVDTCEGWSVTSSVISLVLIVARIGPQLVVLSFTAEPSVDTKTLPSSAALTSKALANVDAAI